MKVLLAFICTCVLGLSPPSSLAQNKNQGNTNATPAANITLFRETQVEGCLMGGPDTFLLMAGSRAAEFYLQGNQAVLKPYVGHQVALMGIATPGTTSGPGAGVLNFKVETISDLGPRCTGGGGPVNLEAVSGQKTTTEAATTAAAAPQRKAARTEAQAQSSAVVMMTDDQLKFMPATIQVKAGQTVTWKNASKEVHTVTGDPGKATNPKDVQLPQGAQPFNSGYLNPGQNYQHTFTKPGRYRYVCTLHEAQGMIGEVVAKR